MSSRAEFTQKKLSASKRRARVLNQYNRLEKHLLAPNEAGELWRYREQLATPDTIFYHQVGGWMLAEAALISTDLDQNERHALLDMAQWDWEAARDHQLQKDSAKEAYRFHLPSSNMLRLEANLAAAEVFRGIIDGDITETHRQNYSQSLLYLAVKASEGVEFYDPDFQIEQPVRRAENYIGVAHELNALAAINRLGSPTLMAFPALSRADSGLHFPSQTHDIQIFKMRWGEIEDVLGAEVKTTLKDEHFARYEAILLGGSLHLHPNHERNPGVLAELLAKENRLIATPEEHARLNHITNTVIHVIRHGFNKTSQCDNPASCVAVKK